MSSYGDPHAGSAGQGRAQVNRDGYGYQYDDHDDVARRGPQPASSSGQRDAWPDNGGGYGRASAGGVPGAPAAGRASVGRAGVPGAGTAGRASVPGPGMGRAGVRPGGPDGPGGPRGSRGKAGGKGSGPAGSKEKKAKRIKIITASFAAFLILFGVGAVGGTYYFDSVAAFLPDKLDTAQVTEIMAVDGRTQIAQLGTENRTDVPIEAIPEQIRYALIAGEDKDFFHHHGISYTGIMSAAWNNFTGGDKRGASTITQQYIKLATQHAEISYGRKLREAVLARKLEDKYSKPQIMGFYLNTVDFGRGAVGVQKAAQAYFNKNAKDLTVPEAAVLGAVIKDPYGDGNGALGPYDPEAHPDSAQERWSYVLNMMVDAKWLGQADRDAMKFPVDKVRKASTVTTSAEWGIKVKPGSPVGTATGNVVNYVYQELKAQGIEPKDLKTGGYRVITTINPKAQRELEKAARPDIKGSEMYGAKPNFQSAGVAIDPTNGQVIAYYGGLDGTGTDFAGTNDGPNGKYGGHAPGSSMKIYTLAAALEANISLQTHWRANPFRDDQGHFIGNAGSDPASCRDWCTLEQSLVHSYNVPFYWVAREIGPGKVLDIARAAGVKSMWDNTKQPMRQYDLGKNEQKKVGDRGPFDWQVGYGQYPITVFDHASGVATFANGGVYNAPHFVKAVQQKDPVTGQFKLVAGKGEKLKPVRTIRPEVANDVTYAMQKVFAGHHWSIDHGRPTASKTGTWEAANKSKENAHAWVVGFTKQVAVAVWTGNATGESPVIDPKTKSTVKSTDAPYRIWKDFLDGYTKGMTKQQLADASHYGDDNDPRANGVSPTPASNPGGNGNGNGNGSCFPMLTCPTNPDPGSGGKNQTSPTAAATP